LHGELLRTGAHRAAFWLDVHVADSLAGLALGHCLLPETGTEAQLPLAELNTAWKPQVDVSRAGEISTPW
jgi:hypothetical protein